jgi:hypothetical protein
MICCAHDAYSDVMNTTWRPEGVPFNEGAATLSNGLGGQRCTRMEGWKSLLQTSIRQ